MASSTRINIAKLCIIDDLASQIIDTDTAPPTVKTKNNESTDNSESSENV